MHEIIRPVRFGILIGLLGLVFGIGWAFYLVLAHENIHETLERSEKHVSLINLLMPEDAQAHTKTTSEASEGDHMHKANEEPHVGDTHKDPVQELSHRRLLRGHIHLMGLALVTITISLLLAFSSASDTVKKIASILTGIGGIIYPIAWIVMGYRTPALGPDGAEASVMAIAGIGVALVLMGIFTTIAIYAKPSYGVNGIKGRKGLT